MNVQRLFFTGLVLGVCLGAAVILTRKHRGLPADPAVASTDARSQPMTNPSAPASSFMAAITNDPSGNRFKIKSHALTDDEKTKFKEDFEKKYKPAVARWFSAYGEHVPFPMDAVTPDAFMERIGAGSSHDYVFVVDGITLGVRDQPTQTFVSYMNAPEQSRHLMELPADGRNPITALPVTREEISRMIQQDSGTRFPDDQIRISPTGLSGALNGGVFVDVGGNPENAISCAFSLVFGKDGKLVYYMTGPFKMAKPPKP